MKQESHNILICALILAAWLGLVFADVLFIMPISNELSACLLVLWLLVSMIVIGG